MTAYCLGFLFDEERTHVVLIEKRRPAWQKGHFNGIGGHVEAGERAVDAMVREAREEAGIPSSVAWEVFAKMHGTDWEVFCYRAFNTRAAEEANGDGDGDEKISYVPLAALPHWPVLTNLHWLIPLALDPGTKPSMGQHGPRYASVDYSPVPPSIPLEERRRRWDAQQDQVTHTTDSE